MPNRGGRALRRQPKHKVRQAHPDGSMRGRSSHIGTRHTETSVEPESLNIGPSISTLNMFSK